MEESSKGPVSIFAALCWDIVVLHMIAINYIGDGWETDVQHYGAWLLYTMLT